MMKHIERTKAHAVSMAQKIRPRTEHAAAVPAPQRPAAERPVSQPAQRHQVVLRKGDGRFEATDEVLGVGSYAKVVVGIDKTTGKKVALKVIKVGANPVLLEAAVTEASLLMQIDHPNIVKVYDVYVKDDSIVVVMELCEGGSLWDLMAEKQAATAGPPQAVLIEQLKNLKPLPVDLCRTVARGITDALVYCHKRNIVHRDMKPMNILLTYDGVPKLADFGIALSMTNKVEKMPKMTGTMAFMAPELFHFFVSKKGSSAVDIYSFGLTLECMLSGKLPYSNVQGGVMDIIRAHKGKTAYVVDRSIPSDAASFIKCCVQSEPTQRATAETLMKHPWLSSR